MFTIQISCYSI